MCQISDEMRQAVSDCNAGTDGDGKAWLFGVRALMMALGIPRGDAVGRIIIDAKHDAFVQVYVCRGGGFPNGAEPLVELLSGLQSGLVHDTGITPKDELRMALLSLPQDDVEVAHGLADKALLAYLRQIGHGEVADSFEDARAKVGFYYA